MSDEAQPWQQYVGVFHGCCCLVHLMSSGWLLVAVDIPAAAGPARKCCFAFHLSLTVSITHK
jgi:hypothetical protein